MPLCDVLLKKSIIPELTHDRMSYLDAQYQELPGGDNAANVQPSSECSSHSVPAASNLQLRPESTVDPTTPSGFMLISVRRSSVAHHMSSRAHSLSLPSKCPRPSSDLVTYNIDCSHDESSQSSQSRLSDDEYPNDGFYGPGTVEAEEFVDDYLEEEDLTHSDTLVLGAPGIQLKYSKNVFQPDPYYVNGAREVSPYTAIQSVSVHTAPVSGHASPSLTPGRTQMLKPYSLHTPCTADHIVSQSFSNQTQNHPPSTVNPVLYSHCNGQAHGQHAAALQQAVVFLRQLHANAAADSTSGVLLEESNTNGNRLLPNVTAMSVASLPNLQPASRFRKARIYETVEQWSHGRATIHDCRLKAIPDWVWELHKKPSVLEGDVASAIVQKVSCSSCVTTKQLDAIGKRLGISKSTGPINVIERSGLNRPISKSDVSQPRPTTLNCEAYHGNLFSFWEGGCRVNPTSLDFSNYPFDQNLPLKDKANQTTDVCPVCTGMMIFKDPDVSCGVFSKSSDNVFSATLSGHYSHLDQKDLVFKTVNGDVSLDPVTNVDINPTLSNGLPSDKPTDPATAYLIHQQLNIANGFSVAGQNQDFTDNPISSPSVEPPNQMRETSHVMSFLPTEVGSVRQTDADEAVQPLKPECSQQISGLAPPTSPALALSEDPQSNWPEADPSSVAPSTTANGVVHNEPTVVSTVTALHVHDLPSTHNIENHRVLRLGDYSGKYHNIFHVDSPQKTDGKDDQSDDASWINLMQMCRTTAKDQFPTGADNILARPFAPSLGIASVTCDSVLQPGVSRSRSLTQSLAEKLFRDSKSSERTRPALSKRLEERISESVDAVRTTIEEAFREELAAAHSENLVLLSEVERLTNEVSTLRGYQMAFHALRPFVAPEIWNHLCNQQLGSLDVTTTTSTSCLASQNGFSEHPT